MICASPSQSPELTLLGMASRMALSLGLDLDGTYLGLPPRDAAVRQWTLFVCVIFER